MGYDLVTNSACRNFVQPELLVFPQVIQKYVHCCAGWIERIQGAVKNDLCAVEFGERDGEAWVVQHCLQGSAEIVNHSLASSASCRLNQGPLAATPGTPEFLMFTVDGVDQVFHADAVACGSRVE